MSNDPFHRTFEFEADIFISPGPPGDCLPGKIRWRSIDAWTNAETVRDWVESILKSLELASSVIGGPSLGVMSWSLRVIDSGEVLSRSESGESMWFHGGERGYKQVPVVASA